jgi:hypothetical protein
MRRAARIGQAQRPAPARWLATAAPEQAVRRGIDEGTAMQIRRASTYPVDVFPDRRQAGARGQTERRKHRLRETEGEVEASQDAASAQDSRRQRRHHPRAGPRTITGRPQQHGRRRLCRKPRNGDTARTRARAAPVDRPDLVEAVHGAPRARSARSRAQYSRRLAISRSNPRSTGR